jgi:membrane-bound ClpP family serine protease
MTTNIIAMYLTALIYTIIAYFTNPLVDKIVIMIEITNIIFVIFLRSFIVFTIVMGAICGSAMLAMIKRRLKNENEN